MSKSSLANMYFSSPFEIKVGSQRIGISSYIKEIGAGADQTLRYEAASQPGNWNAAG